MSSLRPVGGLRKAEHGAGEYFLNKNHCCMSKRNALLSVARSRPLVSLCII
jgi:hypothetical protein